MQALCLRSTSFTMNFMHQSRNPVGNCIADCVKIWREPSASDISKRDVAWAYLVLPEIDPTIGASLTKSYKEQWCCSLPKSLTLPEMQ